MGTKPDLENIEKLLNKILVELKEIKSSIKAQPIYLIEQKGQSEHEKVEIPERSFIKLPEFTLKIVH